MRLRPTAAISLVELLVVLVIIVLLAGMLLPAIGAVKSSAHGSRCLSNLRQIGLAAQGYQNDNQGCLVPTRSNIPCAWNGFTYWWMALAPYCEEETGAGNLASRRVVRGCPAWPTSEFYRTEPGIIAGTYTLPTGYGETVFTKPMSGPAPYTSGNLFDGYGSYTVRAAAVGRTAERPFFADCPRWFLWLPWESTTRYIANYDRHRARCNTLYFDGHAAALTRAQVSAGQLLP